MLLQGRLLFTPYEPPELGWLRVKGGLRGGQIEEIGSGEAPGIANAGDEDCLICPGFIDAHTHLPQFDAVGCDGLALMDWLREVIYPAELRWANGPVAFAAVESAMRRMAAAGTLGFAGFLTSHAHGVGCVVEAVRRFPMRCIVGQTLMDRVGPAALTSQEPQPVKPVDGRIGMSVNPRFAVGCSDHLLRLAANLAGEIAAVQTHLAESREECEIVRKLFPGDEHYTAVYDRHRLLSDRTLLAHGVHLSDAEWKLIAQRKSVVVHCPGANTFLKSGLFDLQAAMEHGVRVALGSDVAAGPDVAMPRVARAMIDVAKMRAMTIDQDAYVPSPAEAWEMITRGNADALGWRDAGRLEEGAAADLLLLRPGVEMDRHLIGRLIHGWRDEWIVGRVVNGKLWD